MPSTRSVRGSRMRFVHPSVRPMVSARPDAVHGNFVISTSTPWVRDAIVLYVLAVACWLPVVVLQPEMSPFFLLIE